MSRNNTDTSNRIQIEIKDDSPVEEMLHRNCMDMHSNAVKLASDLAVDSIHTHTASGQGFDNTPTDPQTHQPHPRKHRDKHPPTHTQRERALVASTHTHTHTHTHTCCHPF